MPHSFIGIHDKSEEARILYLSSGVLQAMGMPAQTMVGSSAYGFITDDPYLQSYPSMYCGDADETSVTIMNVNAMHSGGAPVATRLVAFSCDTCILVVAMMFPDMPCVAPPTLNIQRMQGPEAAGDSRGRISVHVTQAPHPRACLVVEHVSLTSSELAVFPGSEQAGIVSKPNGPHIVFVTNSISRVVRADGDELINTPFLQLVAPESLSRAAQFLQELATNEGVMFSTLLLLENPLADPLEAVAGNRVEVEIVGAHSDDGAVLLCRRVRVRSPAEAAADFDRRLTSRVPESDGYLSLSDLLSSDLETSDCPSTWASSS
ncbi:hypothetical protein GGI02_003614 [Coemansia sp. RSA 2322]|nr:hypothetical protein GGI02_003614 [Coemansia sp. RSA 2322]